MLLAYCDLLSAAISSHVLHCAGVATIIANCITLISCITMNEREQMVYKDLQYAIFFFDVFISFVHVLRL